MDEQAIKRTALAIKYLEQKLSILGEAHVFVKEVPSGKAVVYYVKYNGVKEVYRYQSLVSLFRALGLDINKFYRDVQPKDKKTPVSKHDYNSLMFQSMMIKLKLDESGIAYVLKISVADVRGYISQDTAIVLPRKISELLDLLGRFESIRRRSQLFPEQHYPVSPQKQPQHD